VARKPTKYTVTDGELVLVLEVAEDGGFVVTAPFNPHVLTQAESVEEAFEMARDLIALFEEDAAAERREKKTVRKRGSIKKTG
jgi:predicted RNase H-like HicB family nuclease